MDLRIVRDLTCTSHTHTHTLPDHTHTHTHRYRQVKNEDNPSRQAAIMKIMKGVVINERYRLDACLGAGSYGQGWKATDLKTSQVVFLKTFKLESCEGTLMIISQSNQIIHTQTMFTHTQDRHQPVTYGKNR